MNIELAGNTSPEGRSLLRLVHVGILVSLLWKIIYFIVLDRAQRQYPLVDPFFPSFFRSLTVAEVAYGLCIVASLAVLLLRQQRAIVAACGISFACLCVLSVHQMTYNDVTFMCCGWASLWCLWFSTRLHEPFTQVLHSRATWLTHAILSLIFLGGAVGKMTPGYWSGEVLYEIYFKSRDFWTYNLMRESLSEPALRTAATWHSRAVIVGELACCFLWLLPHRVASWLAIVMLCGIALTNNVLLFSVVTSLIGLALVGLHQSKTNEGTAN